MATLEELATLVSSCTRCPLAEGRTQVVFGVGNPDADLLFVGEGPGREEDLKGEPFVGRSGQLLDRVVLEEMGLTRQRDFYVCNVIKCLRYTALVQLGDGSWERIGRLVARGYDGTVMSVDGGGNLVPRRVVGWHASPLAGRRVFKLSYRSSKRAGVSRSGIELTGDHEVMTDLGWCAVQDLPAGARIATGQGLSALAFDVVCGTLLGDGHVNRGSSHLCMTHSAKQGEYAELKGFLLEELAVRTSAFAVASVVGGKREHDVVRVRTLAHRSLRILRNDFYPTGEKVVPSWIEQRLNPRMLAFWFLDDGSLNVGRGRPTAEIATCSFSPDDLAVLVRALARLGLAARTARGRLHFAADAARKLSELIAPFVPPSMRYKLHPEVALAVRFDASRFEAGPRHVMYDEVDVTEVVHHGSDKTFYCIDVEETNNFVTSGGVVHNCRPPGNRDPLPAEIASCRPYLEQQIELIKPKVIVTLGNFATKLLLDTTEGITKLRGKTYPYGDAVLVPTFHPAAILRGGPVPLAQMRADLIRAKEALRAVTTTA